MKAQGKDRIIVAIDTPNPENAISLAKRVLPIVGLVKVGLEFFHAMRMNLLGWSDERAAEFLKSYREFHRLVKGRVFDDPKLHDIPNTVAAASNEASALAPRFFNVHASAGIQAMKKAVENKNGSLVLAVTVLTSLGEKQVHHIYGVELLEKVVQFASDAVDAGVDGIVCSPKELEVIRGIPKLEKLITVVPGVRPSWASADDQQRVMTPGEAVKAGADYLVIGRPILKPPESVGTPEEAIRLISEEIELAEKEMAEKQSG